MRKKLLPLAIATVLACVTAATGLAAGSTKVEHFSDTHPTNVCGFSGTTAIHGTTVFRDTGNGTYFRNLTFFAVFTADNGKSATLSFLGPEKQTSLVIDEQAGTVTTVTTYGGVFEKLSITRGPTLTRDAGIVTLVDVWEYTGDPNDPVGDLISETMSGLHGPHPELLSGFSLFCDVLVPYLQDV
ncbi:MAG TPA: hypothetical protein VHI55_03480 [Gaiellaceae bacterium]|nr:hypothetical protein [Gaiellaceae bacterium]